MQMAPFIPDSSPDYRQLDADALRALLAQKEAEHQSQLGQFQAQIEINRQQLDIHQQQLDIAQKHLQERSKQITEQQRYIALLEEYLRLAKAQKYGPSSEKLAFQGDLFDEAELEVALSEFEAELREGDRVRPPAKTRERGFSPNLPRVRIELTLSEAEKAGAARTFFTKVKEELEFIPAKLQVVEYWQERAVFEQDSGEDTFISAKRPVHPLGKCFASIMLLAQIIVSKYADGLPLYRQEGQFKRFGVELSRSCMAEWIVRLGHRIVPVIDLIRQIQNTADYLQGDETRIQVLKEPGRKAQSDKWMWVMRGGPPGKEAVLFDYDPSRGGAVPVRLLEGFSGVLQCDGYSGYGRVCSELKLTRIGCMDHARRKFVEASKAAPPAKGKGRSAKPTKADVALSKIGKLYCIEKKIKLLEASERLKIRQEQSVPVLEELKTWLETNLTKVPKGGKTHGAIQYMLNQWQCLIGYCEDGQLEISNVMAENAIRPFAIGRKAWLFSDTPQGARASAVFYSLIETTKLHRLEPYAYIRYLLAHIADANSEEKLTALLPWNVPLEKMAPIKRRSETVNTSV